MTDKQSSFHFSWSVKKRTFLVEKYHTTDKRQLMDLIQKDIFSDGITPQNQDPKFETKSLDDKLKKLKIADLRLKIWEKVKYNGFTLEQLKAIIEGEDIPLPIREDYTPTETTKPEPTKTNPTEKNIQFKSLGTTITHKPKKILQDDGTLRCKRCNRCFDMQGFDCVQLDNYRKHCEEIHGGLNEDERKELLEIYPN